MQAIRDELHCMHANSDFAAQICNDACKHISVELKATRLYAVLQRFITVL